MSRRIGRSVQRRLDSFWSALKSAAAGKPLILAKNAVEDHTHPGYVLRFPDASNPAHWFAQTDHAKQVVMPTARASLGGALACDFTGAEWYESNASPADWAFVYSDSMCGRFTYTPTPFAGVQVLFDAGDAAASKNSFTLYTTGGSTSPALGDINTALFRSDGVIQGQTGSCLLSNSGATIEFAFDNAAPQRILDANRMPEVASGTLTSTGGASTTPARIGGRGDLYQLYGAFHSLLFAPFGAVKRAAIEAYVLRETGLSLAA